MTKLYEQQAVTNVVNPIDMSGPLQAMDTANKTVLKQADKSAEQATKTLETGLKTSNTIEMGEHYQELSNDPEELSKRFTQMNEAAMKIPVPEVRDEVLNSNAKAQSSFMAKAQVNYDKNETRRAKISTIDNIKASIGLLEVDASVFFSGGDTTDIKGKIVDIESQIKKTDTDGFPLLDSSTVSSLDKELSALKVDGYKAHLDELFSDNPDKAMKYISEVREDTSKLIDSAELTRKEYDQIAAYNKKATEIYKEERLFSFYNNPSEEGLNRVLALNPEMLENQVDKLTGFWETSKNYEKVTTYPGLDRALTDIQKLARLNTNTEESRKVYLDETIKIMDRIDRSNTDENTDNISLSADDVQDLSAAMWKMSGNKMFKDLLAEMPDTNAFMRIARKSWAEADSLVTAPKGSVLKELALKTTIVPRWLWSEHISSERIEDIGETTSKEMMKLLLEGDQDGAEKVYADGIEKAIKEKYYYIPEMRGNLIPGETTFDINGKRYLFKGYGAEDIIVEVSKWR